MWEVQMKSLSIIVVGLALLVAGSAAATQESASSAKAAVLTKLLDQQQLDAIAVEDPDDPNRFIAALYYPGAQLLAVSAVYPAPELLQQRIAEGKYRDVYVDLQVPATQQGRFFVMDLQADGLHSSRRGAAAYDVTYENGGNQVSFDGDWKRQKLGQSQYNSRFEADDQRYARMLAALERKLTSATTPPAAPAKGGRLK